MSETDVDEILKLLAEERLKLIEILWESLSRSQPDIPLGDAHCAAIDRALDGHRRSPDDVLTKEQIFSAVHKAR